MPVKVAESIKGRVENIVASQCSGLPLDAETARWVGTLSDELAARLAGVGLVANRQRLTLAGFTRDYLDGHRVKPSTRTSLGLGRDRMLAHFGDRPLTSRRLPSATASILDRRRTRLKG